MKGKYITTDILMACLSKSPKRQHEPAHTIQSVPNPALPEMNTKSNGILQGKLLEHAA